MSRRWSLVVLALWAHFNGRVIISTVGIPLCGSHLNGLSLFLTGFMAFMDAFCGAVQIENFGVRRTPVKAVSKTLALAPSYIDVSFPRPSFSPCLGILVTWLLIDPLLTEPFIDYL